jgi:hypothetical protein
MKKYITFFAALTLALAVMAQGNSDNKSQGKDKSKDKSQNEGKNKAKKDNDAGAAVWAGTKHSGKPSKNQPAKVREAFNRDFPNATNVVWTKYQGDWTATFNNSWGRPTAVYHANGARRDTRIPVTLDQLPNRSKWDMIFKRDGVNPVGQVIKVEAPSLSSEIYRIASLIEGSKTQYLFYDKNGLKVEYKY